MKLVFHGPIGRLLRGAVSLAITAAVAKYQGNVWYISATPLIQTAAKALREKYPGKFDWVPL